MKQHINCPMARKAIKQEFFCKTRENNGLLWENDGVMERITQSTSTSGK